MKTHELMYISIKQMNTENTFKASNVITRL